MTVAVCLVALVVGACAGGIATDGAAAPTTSPAIPAPDEEDTPDPPAASTEGAVPDEDAATPGVRPDEDPTDAPGDDDADGDEALPGVPWTGPATAGDALAVFGVPYRFALNVRTVPGTSGAILAAASPTDEGIVATGRGRRLPATFWYEVSFDGVTGWASARFLAFPGPVDDVTSAFVEEHGRPVTETMHELGRIVAEAYASTDPPSGIVETGPPAVGEVGEVVVDVVGIGDDAVRGLRLHVIATPDPSSGDLVLQQLMAWTFCNRAPTVDGGRCEWPPPSSVYGPVSFSPEDGGDVFELTDVVELLR